MGDDGTTGFVRMARFTHGTARPCFNASVLPANRREQEVFWVRTVAERFAGLQSGQYRVESNPDDSHGGHDVLLQLCDRSVGVQVTELTHELHRERESQRKRYVQNVLGAVRDRGITSPDPVVVQWITAGSPARFRSPLPADIAAAIGNGLQNPAPTFSVTCGECQLVFQRVNAAQICVPAVGNIGFDCTIDQLPQSLPMYETAVDAIAERKASSSSSWLVIWSLSFWQCRHLWESAVVERMHTKFRPMRFDFVVFVDSIDGPGLFEANLRLREISSRATPPNRDSA